MTYRRLSEWNRAHQVPAPAFVAGVVTMASAVVNEMYAHPGYTEGTAATAADLLFFDPLGIAVFSIDGVARFVSETVGGNIWSGQAALTPDGDLVNNGNGFVVKPKSRRSRRRHSSSGVAWPSLPASPGTGATGST